MKFAIGYGTAQYGMDPDHLVAFARRAEDLGFEALYLPEHVALAPGMAMGDTEFPTDLEIADPLVCLSFVAAATSRLLLGTGVLLLPYHHPVPLAKRLATLDVLSRGRLRLVTIGVGSFPQEAAAAGVPFATRGRRTDEALAVLRLLWSSGPEGATFDGEFFRLDSVASFPKPVGGPLPIHVAGSSRAAARRAGRLGAGWFPGGMLPPAERLAQWDLVRETAASAGRPAPEHTRWGSFETTPEGVAGFARQGVTRLVINMPGEDPATRLGRLADFAKRHGL